MEKERVETGTLSTKALGSARGNYDTISHRVRFFLLTERETKKLHPGFCQSMLYTRVLYQTDHSLGKGCTEAIA